LLTDVTPRGRVAGGYALFITWRLAALSQPQAALRSKCGEFLLTASRSVPAERIQRALTHRGDER